MDYLGSRNPSMERWGFMMWEILHYFILRPLATIFSIASLAPQVQLLRSRSDPGALSVLGLVTQAAIFALNAVLWPRRVCFDWERWSRQGQGLNFFINWYSSIGFVALDTGIFAVVQAILLAIAIHQRSRNLSPEIQPLLPNST